MLSERVRKGMSERKGSHRPIRDGEYAFYRLSLGCNGLYEQAESVEAIRRAIPAHAEDLRHVAGTGLLAPLVFPGNVGPVRRRFPAFWKRWGDDGAARFLRVPSGSTASCSEGRTTSRSTSFTRTSPRAFSSRPSWTAGRYAILNSDIDMASCAAWFSALPSRPSSWFPCRSRCPMWPPGGTR